nr:MAG TPA_asm: hypothetical protein [Caudoviricetes sp.]
MIYLAKYTKWHCFDSAILLYISHGKAEGRQEDER